MLKHLISWTAFDMFSCIGDTQVTHRTVVPEFRGQLPGLTRMFMCFFYSVVAFLLRHDVVRVFVSSLLLVFVRAILSWCP